MAMKNFLTMAALALVGAIMAGCSGSDDIIDNPQPPTQKDNIVTVTTTISLAAGGGEEGGATTRALNPATGVKTFAEGDQIAVIYKNTRVSHPFHNPYKKEAIVFLSLAKLPVYGHLTQT